MTRRDGLTEESYACYLTESEIAKVYRLIRGGAKPPLSTAPPPPPQFYGTCYGRKCRRYFCTVCGSLATTNLHGGHGQKYGREQRAVDWLSGTTLPDAITRAQQFHTELHIKRTH
ncbi:hypothetical protein CSKR_109125 [Clonorchis sinensis]|uniref:Uncharacterized protein n=2 Tax=Clonorchis sinensis TaxID=79923 RepID=A0A8T1MR48_CLOSI|nr:hypothetical protein CSKR_109125 [Clonorchis sinensis]GAA51118.1 hypothetical protein CLF_105610 [Clonorchis sinensis]